ncbi:hypothetical protein AAKU55_001604 [Oxalobacteraceae bacterium GrIS 1.11]
MNLNNLNDYINLLDDAIGTLRPSRVQQLEWLRYDLDVYARNNLNTPLYRRAWDRIVGDRLDAINVPTRIRSTINTIKLAVRADSAGVSFKIHFGQQRVAGNFQAPNVNQVIPGFPLDMAVAPLAAVEGKLRQGHYLPDQIPIQIFWHIPLQRWITANNRGYTVHCLAGVRPLRLLPTTFGLQAIEVTRLAEVEGVNGIAQWTGNRHGAQNPRQLPSVDMLITPIGNAIERIASVPPHWG